MGIINCNGCCYENMGGCSVLHTKAYLDIVVGRRTYDVISPKLPSVLPYHLQVRASCKPHCHCWPLLLTATHPVMYPTANDALRKTNEGTRNAEVIAENREKAERGYIFTVVKILYFVLGWACPSASNGAGDIMGPKLISVMVAPQPLLPTAARHCRIRS